jgi:hypothetical protein
MAVIGGVTVRPLMARPVLSAEAEQVVGRVRQAVEDGRRAADGLRQSVAGERKARARETVERLKRQISQMMSMAALNPKAAARLLRQMGRQLADAVSEYAKAGGSKAGMAGPPVTFAAAAAPEPAKSAPAAPVATTSGQAAEIAAAATAAEREKARTTYQAVAGAIAARGPDEKFVRESRQMHEQLKALMRAMLARIEDERERDKEARAFDKNAEIVEKGLAEIEGWAAEPIQAIVSPMAPVSLAV